MKNKEKGRGHHEYVMGSETREIEEKRMYL
jgi:hypothetical protein